jgi:antitoxin (DNA-binding transcriptional repressor) of toxin-antitoxin stability system
VSELAEEGNQMATITIENAQARLGELIHQLTPGEELIITENDRPVAKLVATGPAPEPRAVPKLGTQRGSVRYMAPDFDAPLDDFKEYMG